MSLVLIAVSGAITETLTSPRYHGVGVKGLDWGHEVYFTPPLDINVLVYTSYVFLVIVHYNGFAASRLGVSGGENANMAEDHEHYYVKYLCSLMKIPKPNSYRDSIPFIEFTAYRTGLQIILDTLGSSPRVSLWLSVTSIIAREIR